MRLQRIFVSLVIVVSGQSGCRLARAPKKPAVVVDHSESAPSVGAAAGDRWPFAVWDHAMAYTFNTFAPGHGGHPGSQLRVYSEPAGWTTGIASRTPVGDALAERALSMLAETKGEALVSKCPFPRHAVVFFAGEKPVGTINVCFQCGDILIWPPYNRDPKPAVNDDAVDEEFARRFSGPKSERTAADQERIDEYLDKKMKEEEEAYRKQMEPYERTYPLWQAFFEKELGIPTDWHKLPGAAVGPRE